MKRGGLAALALVAAAMAVYLIVDGRRRPAVSERTSGHARLAPAFDRAKTRYITIRRQGSQPFSILHVPSPSAPPPAPEWQLEIDGNPPADDAAVEDLLSAVDLAESDRTADVAPPAAGLEPPAVRLDVETPNGAFAIALGRIDATGQGVYARAGDAGPIRVIGRRLLDLANREPAAFRDRRLFPVAPAAITSIAWRGEDGAGELTLSAGRWQNARKEQVANERVAEALRRLLALRVDTFTKVGPPGARAGGRTLTVTAGAARIALEVGKDGALTRGDERVQVSADAFEAAWRSLAAAAARDDRLISQPPETVTRVDLWDDRARVDLRRVGGAWTFTAPKVAYAADTRAVDDWLARLGAVKAATRAGGPNTRHVIVEGRFREQADVSSPAEVHALLAPDPSRFRERTVLSFARFDLRRLQRRAGKTTQAVTTDEGGTWRGADGAPADAARVGQVAGALGDLRAEEFVAAPPGAASVTWEIDLQPPGERKPLRHVVETWPQKDGCVARLDREATFRPERATCDALRMELLKTAE